MEVSRNGGGECGWEPFDNGAVTLRREIHMISERRNKDELKPTFYVGGGCRRMLKYSSNVISIIEFRDFFYLACITPPPSSLYSPDKSIFLIPREIPKTSFLARVF